MLWYQLTGAIWSGGPVPALSSFPYPAASLYSAHLADVGDTQDSDDLDAEVAIDALDPDSWLIRVPTSLVWLETDTGLRDFEAV